MDKQILKECPRCGSSDVYVDASDKSEKIWECAECKTRCHADGKLTKRGPRRATSYHDFVSRACYGSIHSFRGSHPDWMVGAGVSSLAKRITRQLTSKTSREMALALLLFPGRSVKLERLEQLTSSAP